MGDRPGSSSRVRTSEGQSVQKRLVLVCEDSLCPRKQPDVSGPGLGEAGRYRYIRFLVEGHRYQRKKFYNHFDGMPELHSALVH